MLPSLSYTVVSVPVSGSVFDVTRPSRSYELDQVLPAQSATPICWFDELYVYFVASVAAVPAIVPVAGGVTTEPLTIGWPVYWSSSISLPRTSSTFVCGVTPGRKFPLASSPIVVVRSPP